jgi:hypothetical protein
MRRMQVEILFNSPHDVSSGLATLIEHDFSYRILEDWIDEYGPAVFVRAWVLSELGEDSVFDWATTIIEPAGGEILEAGLADEYTPEELRNELRERVRQRRSGLN